MTITIISFIAIIFLLIAIKKEIDMQITLILSAFFLFISAHFLGINIMEKTHGNVKDTGYLFFNLFELLKGTFSYRIAGLGLVIMTVGGFSAYMFHIGASQMLVKVSLNAFSFIKKPYLLMVSFFFLNQFLSMVITSATGLGLLLMTTEYRILRGFGLSRYSAVGLIATSTSLEFGPLMTPTIISSSMLGINPVEYFVKYRLPIVIPVILIMALTHYFWQKHNDKKENYNPKNDDYSDLKESQNSEIKAPKFYAFLPFIPFFLVLMFNKYTGKYIFSDPYNMNIIVAILISVTISIIIHTITTKKIKDSLDGWNRFIGGMARVWSVVSLIVAAELFAISLIKIGAISMLVNNVSHAGLGGGFMSILFSAITFITSSIVGSGNSAFLAFGSMIPDVATQFNIDPTNMIVPLQFASSLGRTVSPIAGVIIACAGLAGISTKALVKRTSVPILVGTLTMIIAHSIFNGFN